MSRSCKEAALITNELISKMWCIQAMKYHMAMKKKGNSNPFYNLSAPWKHYAKWHLHLLATHPQGHLGPGHHPEWPARWSRKLRRPASEPPIHPAPLPYETRDGPWIHLWSLPILGLLGSVGKNYPDLYRQVTRYSTASRLHPAPSATWRSPYISPISFPPCLPHFTHRIFFI